MMASAFVVKVGKQLSRLMWRACRLCRVFEQGGVQLVVDPVSFEFVRGATVDYTTDIIRSAFEVRAWPLTMSALTCMLSADVQAD